MEKKKEITIIAGNKTYENLSTFKTINELNDTVRAYKEKFANQLNKTQLAVLNHLHTHSAKFLAYLLKRRRRLLKPFILVVERLLEYAYT